jgi:hypothetical protein
MTPMELTEAVKRHLPLQVRLPDRTKPLESLVLYAAEVFLVETGQGPAVIWLDPFWCERAAAESCHIAYVSPRRNNRPGRWIDTEPRYGPYCIAYQNPFVIEQLDQASPAWSEYKAWKIWREGRGEQCGRRAAWERMTTTFGDLILARKC